MTLLDVQSARIARARELSARSDAALAKAEEAKANLSILKSLGGGEVYPQTRTNIIAEWEYWTVEARRLHEQAVAEATSTVL